MLSELQRISDRWAHADQVAEGRLEFVRAITSFGSGGTLLVLISNVLSATFSGAMNAFASIWLLGLVTVTILQRDIDCIGLHSRK